MNKNFFLILCAAGSILLAGCFVPASAEKQPLKKTITPQDTVADPAARWRKLDLKNYPDAHTLLLDDVETVVYNSDGTYIRTDEYYTLILTGKGKDDHKTLTLHFNEFYQKTPSVFLEIIKPDGSVVKPRLQKKISVETSQMQSNIYDPAQKVMTIGIPGLEVNDILHFKFREVCIRPRMKDVFCTISLLQTTDPVLRYSYTISAPEKSPLARVVVKDEVKGTLKRSVKKADGRIFYTFEAVDVPQMLPEPDMPPWYLHSMRVLASTVPDWQSVSRWYYNLCKPRMKAVSPELTAKAKALAAGKNQAEAIRAMFDFVSQEIRYTGVTNENTAPGYEPHDVKDTFAQKHGVCRDKAALLAAMLCEAGFDAFPVLFMAGDPKDPEVPNNYFNHAITGVRTSDGRIVLMDATDENSVDMLPGYAMNKSYLCATEEGDILRRTPVVSAEKNTLAISSQGMIDENFKLQMKSRLTFYGFNDNIYRSAFAQWPKDYCEQFAASALKRALPGAVLEKIEILPENIRDLAQKFELILTYSVKDFVDQQWGAGTMELPFIGSKFGAFNFLVNDQLLKKRKYPLQFESTAAVSETCSIVMPEKLELSALPDYKNINNSALSAVYSAQAHSGKLTAERTVKLHSVEVAAKEYSKFMQAVWDIKSADKNKLVVKSVIKNDKSSYSAAQAVVLDEKYKVVFSSLNEFTTEVSKKIKLLNYGGVKEYSELKLNYVEGVSQAEFVSAKVILPDGKIIDVDLKTVKLMDNAVSLAAPRYPAAKELILPLPGVGPGAVIEYVYRRKNPGKSSPHAIKLLAGFMPVKNSLVEFSFPLKRAGRFKVLMPAEGFPVSVEQKNGMKTVKVRSSDIPMYKNEPSVPPMELFAPVAGISSFDSSEYAAKVLSAFKKAASNAPECAKLAAGFVKKYPDLRARIRAVRDHVAKNIRRAGLEVDVIGCKYITPADTTLLEGYGNSIDRAVVLYSLLKNSGVDDIAVLLTSNLPDLEIIRSRFAEIPQNFFDGALLRVTLDNDEFYLGDTDEYTAIGSTNHENMLALDLAGGELVTIESSAGFSAETRQYWRIKCLPDNAAEITRTSCYYGSDSGVIKRFFDRITPEKERQFWDQQLAGDLAGSEILEIKKELDQYPYIVTLKVKKTDFWKKSGDYVYFDLPGSGSEHILRTAGKRSLPYMYSSSVKRSADYEVDLLSGWRMCEKLPEAFSLAIPGSGSIVSRQTEFSPDMVLRAKEKILLEPFYLESGAYSLLENIQKELSKPGNRTILLKTSGK